MTGDGTPGPGRHVLRVLAAAARELRARLGDPPTFDLALAALLAVLSLAQTVRAPDVPWPARLLAGVVGLAMAGVTIRRRSRPVGVLAMTSLIVPIPFLLDLPIVEFGWQAAVYTVFVYRPWRTAAAAFLIPLAVVPLCAARGTIVLGRPYGTQVAAWTVSVLPLLLVAAALGLMVGADRARTVARRSAAERAERAEALARHRGRIADDLNAVVAVDVGHLVEGTAGLVEGRCPPGGTAAALADIRTRARDALSTVRLLLERLHDDPSDAPPAPDPGLRARSPTRSGLALLAVLTAAVLLVSAFPVLVPFRQAGPEQLHLALDSPVAVAVLAAQLAPFAWWRSAPVAALLVNAAATTLASALASTHYVVDTVSALLYYTAAVGAPVGISAVAVTAALAARVGVDVATGTSFDELYAFTVAVVLALWSIGVLQRRAALRALDEDDARASAERLDALDGQRRRIVGELHDLVGHHLSAVALQAGVARRSAQRGTLDEESLHHLRDSAVEAARSLPAVTRSLDDRPDPGPLDAAAIERLVAPLRAGGLPVTVRSGGDGRVRPVGEADLFARRILQEALTNAVRHGGSAPTSVEVVDEPEAIGLLVRSEPPRADPAPTAGGGLGLAGMRERVDLLGGELETGPDPDGGWSVHARLPRRGYDAAASWSGEVGGGAAAPACQPSPRGETPS